MKIAKSKVVYVNIDGFGISSKWSGNAFKMHPLPIFENLKKSYPFFILDTKYKSKDNFPNHIFNARVALGHEISGDSDLVAANINRISSNNVYDSLIEQCHRHSTVMHLVLTLSDPSAFSDYKIIQQILEQAKNKNCYDIFIHVILKGKDKNSNLTSALNRLQNITAIAGIGKVATILGAEYLSDDKLKFKYTEALNSLIGGKCETAYDIYAALNGYYSKGITDNEVPPTALLERNRTIGRIKDFDSVLFCDLNYDFSQRLINLLNSEHMKLKKGFPSYLKIAKLIETDLNDANLSDIVFEREAMQNSLSEILSNNQIKQLLLSETINSYSIKGFSGFSKKPFPNSRWNIIPSLPAEKVEDSSELSLSKIGALAFNEIQRGYYEFIYIDIPNADFFAHLGSISLASESLRFIDKLLEYLSDLCLAKNYTLIISSSHGSAEEIKSNEKFRAYADSENPVPFIIVDKRLENIGKTEEVSSLLNLKHSIFDIAPTILRLFNINNPSTMIGESLIK